MKILFFDTETTGLFGNKHYSTDFMEFPHIVQIAWQLVDKDQSTLIKNCHTIRPVGYEIPEEVSEIHGIYHKDAVEHGQDLKTVLRHFITDCNEADKIVAHNIYFDTSIIKAGMLKLGINPEVGNTMLHKDKRVCTMKKTIKFVEARYDDGRPGKWPKLEELYMKLFNEDLKDAHTAGGDVSALKKCYFELIKQGIL